MKFTIKRWENDGKKTNKKMEIRKNERKEELQGFKQRVYGMDGVGKQTDLISCSIKRCVIKRVVDGKGIWISYNSSTKKLQRKKEKQPQVVARPC